MGPVTPVVPQLELQKFDPKRKANAWSSNESSPRSPPASPVLSSSQRGCRKVDGVMVSPEPVESPKRVLQRWIDAGRPAVALYALYVHDAEFRAFKRAVSVVAEGEAGSGRSSRRGAPQRKRMRAEDAPINHETAVTLMGDLARVDIAAARKTSNDHAMQAPIQRPNNAVRCFEFGQVCAPLPMLMQHVC